MNTYSQLRAMLAIAKGSLRAIFRSPSTVIFSIGFPLIFIFVFGSIGNNGFSLNLAFSKNSDTLNPIYTALKKTNNLTFYNLNDSLLQQNLEEGSIAAIIDIEKTAHPPYTIHLRSSEAVNPQDLQILQAILNAIIIKSDTGNHIAAIAPDIQKIPGREFREIDRILPGMLGFSLLGTGVFSVAFLFFNLRSQLVIKRFFATPVHRSSLILGEAISRIIFQLLSVILIIFIGYLFFDFTLVKGLVTFVNMMLLCFIACLIFMGCGFIVSSIAKTESVIPVFSNIFVFPQFLLSGTFFSITVFPKWMQVICNVLPLTRFNSAMRNISFEGASLLSSWQDIGVLLIWGIVIYIVAVKVFRWE